MTVGRLSHPDRCHTKIAFLSAPAGSEGSKHKPDGKTITSMVIAMTPTSRGSVTLASTDPTTYPAIDPNYYSTEADIRTGLKKVLSWTLHPHRTIRLRRGVDEAIDARVGGSAYGFYHPGGTCAMGKVVDGDCRVKGMGGLRVVDASIIPLPLGAHYQATVYALAEKATEVMFRMWTLLLYVWWFVYHFSFMIHSM